MYALRHKKTGSLMGISGTVVGEGYRQTTIYSLDDTDSTIWFAADRGHAESVIASIGTRLWDEGYSWDPYVDSCYKDQLEVVELAIVG